MKYALVIKKEKWWGLNSLNLYTVEECDSYFRILGSVNDAPEYGELSDLCRKNQLRSLYDRLGSHSFKSSLEFFEKGDDAARNNVKKLNDGQVCEAVRLAADSGIHLFLGIRHNGVLYFKDELHYEPDPVPVTMKFVKNVSGIEYRLLLNEGIVPCHKHPALICISPSLFAMESRILSFAEGQSGKILLPFLDKESVLIPSRMEAEYFRKFILKSAYKVDIEAEGFAFEDVWPQMDASVCMKRNVLGRYSLELAFRYGDETFEEGSARRKFVRLKNDGEHISFIRTNRSPESEQPVISDLREKLGMPREGALDEVLGWLVQNKDNLSRRNISHRQLTERQYYLGKVTILSDRRNISDWFQLRVNLLFDDGTKIPLAALKDALLGGEREFLLPTGLWFLIPENWFARYAPLLMFGVKVGDDMIKYHKTQNSITEAMEGPTSCKKKDEGTAQDLSLPTGLKAVLRPYQSEGYRWILGHLGGGSGCCLSDDMGLGKTVQTIAVILKYADCTVSSSSGIDADDDEPELFRGVGMIPYIKADPVLVVAPASVVFNWKNEFRRFSPTLSVLEYTGTREERAKCRKLMTKADVTLTTYQTLRNDIEDLSRISFGIVVFDESQQFKNADSVLYRAVIRLKSSFRLALSGTPVENNLSELWSLMSVLVPELLGSYPAFRDNFISPINRNLMGQKTDVLRRMIAPYFLRRMKEDVVDNLPPRQDETVLCAMTQEQKSMYERELSSMRNLLFDGPAGKDTIHILAAITRLRQIASFPAVLESSVPSGKMEAVFDKLEQLSGTLHKALVFSEYVSFLDIVAAEMNTRGWKYEVLTGQSVDRESSVRRFMDDDECRFFLISLKAGGFGLNLTRADYVFILDPWWNSSAEEQAVCRAYRIGQDNPVMVYRFITENTLEQQIVGLQERKSSLIDAVMSVVK